MREKNYSLFKNSLIFPFFFVEDVPNITWKSFCITTYCNSIGPNFVPYIFPASFLDKSDRDLVDNLWILETLILPSLPSKFISRRNIWGMWWGGAAGGVGGCFVSISLSRLFSGRLEFWYLLFTVDHWNFDVTPPPPSYQSQLSDSFSPPFTLTACLEKEMVTKGRFLLQGSLLISKLEFFIKADFRGLSFL